MDALSRSRRLLLIAPAIVVAACAARRTGPIGVSHEPGEAARAAKAGVPAVSIDAGIPSDVEARFAKITPSRVVSNGHAPGRWDVEVYANDAAKGPLVTGQGEVPSGAQLVEFHYERADGGARGPTMMMEKREKGYDPDHGDWRYVVVTASGAVAKDGKVESCAGCHDDAPHDHVFKVPDAG